MKIIVSILASTGAAALVLVVSSALLLGRPEGASSAMAQESDFALLAGNPAGAADTIAPPAAPETPACSLQLP
jgi:hypothetical protein